MSDTPETDAAQFGTGRVSVDFARRLERERDEAIHGSCVNYNYTQEARRERDEWAKLCGQYKQERDEAREAFVIATDQMVIAQGKVREANKERDEARELAQQMSESNQVLMADVRFYRNAWEQRREATQ
jgi:predicted house-cleaning NTP pyrophosphatase (Maf/HAM1 superfamily)